MKSRLFLILSALMIVSAIPAFADEISRSNTTTSTTTTDDTSSVMDETTPSEQAGTAGSTTTGNTSDSTASSDATTGATTGTTTTSGAMMEKAKMDLSPHAVMIHSSLESARDQLRGLRTQADTVPASNKQFMKHARIYNKEIGDTVKQATTHAGELQAFIKNYPDLAKSEEFKQLNTAMDDLRTTYQSWNTQASNQSYWNNKEKVVTDLEAFNKRLSSAIDKSKGFNSELNITMSG